MPLTIYQIHSMFLDDEINFSGSWSEFLLSVVAEVGVFELYDIDQLPCKLSEKVGPYEAHVLSWSRISDPAIALWVAGEIRLCSYTAKGELQAAAAKAIKERAELGSEPITVPVEVQERVERLVVDNPALLARLSLPILNKLSGYINDLMLKDLPAIEQDLLIFSYLSKLVYKPTKKAPPFKVGKLPPQVNQIFMAIDPNGKLYGTPLGVRLYRATLNWIKNGISHDEMIRRAKEMIES